MNSMPEDKGKQGGSCNRRACLKPNAGWFNHSTRAYYCRACARLLNDANRDWAPAQYGHDLCTAPMAEVIPKRYDSGTENLYSPNCPPEIRLYELDGGARCDE